MMNFIFNEMTYLRYFMPLVIEGNRRNIQSNFHAVSNHEKYTKPEKYKDQLALLFEKYNVNLLSKEEMKDTKGLGFVVEGVCADYFSDNVFKVSLSYMTDYCILYNSYVNLVDSIVFPSRSFLNLSNIEENEKNKCLGSPKYDIVFNKFYCMKKYGLLEDQKYALVICPRRRDLSKFPMVDVISSLREMGYTPIIKSRGKEPCIDTLGCLYFEDFSWFPHTTMELIECSDIVINSGSTTIKEAVLLKKPIINFDIKPFPDRLSFLYDYDFAFCEKTINMREFKGQIIKLTKFDWEESFDQCIEDHLFRGVGTSSRILDYYGEYL